MPLELMKESVKLNQVISEDSEQTIVENDIIVPDVKPDIARVLLCDGDIFVNSCEAVHDKIIVNGTILYKILYVCDDLERSVNSINTSTTFSYDLDIGDAGHGMRSKVKCDIEHIDYDILNGRKVNIKTIVRVNGKVTNEVEEEIVSGLEGLENLQALNDTVSVNSYLGNNEANMTIQESLEIPAGKPTIKEILRNDIKITEKEFKAEENKIVANGALNLLTLYIGDDEEQRVQFIENEFPFSQTIELDGLNENSFFDVDCRVVDLRVEATEDSDGELRMIHGEFALNISAEGSERKEVQILSDAYSPSMRVDLEKEYFRTEEVVAENKGQIILKDTILIDNDAPEISEVFNILCKPGLPEYSVAENKLTVEGMVSNNVLYLTNDEESPLSCYQQEMPFKNDLDIEGITQDMICKVNLEVEHCSYSMVSSNQVELRLVIGVSAKFIKELTLPLIVKVNELPLEENKFIDQPSITIYFSQPGDTLWKVAKRYYTTVEDIKRVNDLEEDDAIMPGQQIIIPKKVV